MKTKNPVILALVGFVILALACWSLTALFGGGHPVWGVILAVIWIDLFADVVLAFRRLKAN